MCYWRRAGAEPVPRTTKRREGLAVAEQGKTYRMPVTITVSRKTMKITHVEYAEANEAQFRECCRMILKLHGLDEMAELIPRDGVPNFHQMEI